MSSLARLTVLLAVKRFAPYSSKRFINNLVNKIMVVRPKSFQRNSAIQQRSFSSWKDKPECKKEESDDNACGGRKLQCGGCNLGPKKEKKDEEFCIPEKTPKPKTTNCIYDDPSCCLEKCPDANIRLDCIYYKMSDKVNRKYQQTWVDCPPALIKPKVVCQFPCADKEPPLPKRCIEDKSKVKTACHSAGKDKNLMECNKEKKGACIKIRMPGCRTVRDPPKCKIERRPEDCTKIKCPYPSYSECLKPKIKKGRPTECHCLEVQTLCDIYAMARKKGIKIK